VKAEDRVMLIAPHPDDEALAAAGLLQHAVASGAVVRVLYATDGENNVWAQRAAERRWWVTEAARARWGMRRRREALAALAILGVHDEDVTFLGMPDQGLTNELIGGDGSAVTRLAREIERFTPTILVEPSPSDLHPDHSAVAVLVRFALRRAAPRFRWPRAFDYYVHDHGSAASVFDRGWRVDLTDEQRVHKRDAILAHRSQMVLRHRSLLAFAGPYETFFPAWRADVQAEHPICETFVDGQTLKLRLRQRARAGAFGGSTFYLAIERRQGSWGLGARLPHASGEIVLADVASGAEMAAAKITGTPRARELSVPLAVFREATSIFAKLERRFGFFDEAGWREIPVPKACACESLADTSPRQLDPSASISTLALAALVQ
jgi:LmbE family N-acetylglucosaminyl deacetylase